MPAFLAGTFDHFISMATAESGQSQFLVYEFATQNITQRCFQYLLRNFGDLLLAASICAGMILLDSDWYRDLH